MKTTLFSSFILILLSLLPSPAAVNICRPFFTGRNSYLALEAADNLRHLMHLDIVIVPESLDDALIFYAAKYLDERSGDFISVSLNGGLLELRYNLGSLSTTVISSRSLLPIGKLCKFLVSFLSCVYQRWIWCSFSGTSTRITAVTRRTNGYLFVNGSLEAQGKAANGMVSLDIDAVFYLGNLYCVLFTQLIRIFSLSIHSSRWNSRFGGREQVGGSCESEAVRRLHSRNAYQQSEIRSRIGCV